MRILFASNNKGKLKEVREIFAEHEILSLAEAGLHVEVVEDGKTFEENAVKKAKEVMLLSGQITLSDDSGLEVDFLGGAPGVYSARYAGEGATNEMMIDKLLSELKDVPPEKRTARFVSVVALVFPEGKTVTAHGSCEGSIAFSPDGEAGFGYDPIFISAVNGKTFARLTSEEKNALSHRGEALRKLKSMM